MYVIVPLATVLAPNKPVVISLPILDFGTFVAALKEIVAFTVTVEFTANSLAIILHTLPSIDSVPVTPDHVQSDTVQPASKE